MADIFYPVQQQAFALAGELEAEAESLKTGIEMIGDTLQYQYTDAEQSGRAQSHMYFLLSALEHMQKRISELAIDAFALNGAVKDACAQRETVKKD